MPKSHDRLLPHAAARLVQRPMQVASRTQAALYYALIHRHHIRSVVLWSFPRPFVDARETDKFRLVNHSSAIWCEKIPRLWRKRSGFGSWKKFFYRERIYRSPIKLFPLSAIVNSCWKCFFPLLHGDGKKICLHSSLDRCGIIMEISIFKPVIDTTMLGITRKPFFSKILPRSFRRRMQRRANNCREDEEENSVSHSS